MKKKLSILLVATMALSMVPTSVFASSSNKPTSQPIVAKDKVISTVTETAPGAYAFDGVSLVLDLDDANTKAGEVLFTLENGKWQDADKIGKALLAYDQLHSTSFFTAGINTGSTVYQRMSDTQLMINIPAAATNPDPAVNPVAGKIAVPMMAKSGSTAGDVKVTLDPRDSDFSAGTYTIAVMASGSTVASIVKKDITVGEFVDLNALVIDETVIAGVEVQKIKLLAPAGFTWKQGSVTINGIAGYAETNGTYNAATQTGTLAWDNNDKETAVITFPTFYKSLTKRGMLSIAGLSLTADTDVPTGDVKVEVQVLKNASDVATTQSDVVFANCVDYGYTITAATPKEVISGRFDNGSSYRNSTHETAKITIKEDTANSWWANRATTFAVPEGVKILGMKVNTFENVTAVASGLAKDVAVDFTAATLPNGVKISSDENLVTLTGLGSVDNKKAKLEVTFYLSTAADYTGDVTVTVGNSVEDKDLVVATAKPAVSAKFDTTNIGIANQDVTTGDITIVENMKGALKKDQTLQISMDSVGGNIQFVKNGKLDFEVKEGNAIVEKVYSRNGIINVELKRASTTPSTIVIKGLAVTLDRTPAEGNYGIKVNGLAFLENGNTGNTTQKGKFEYVTSLEFDKYVNVTTAAPDRSGSTINKVAVTIGSTTYKVNGIEKTLDAAPVMQNDRTLVPTRAISEGLGYQVLWNEVTNTATIVAPDNRTAAFTLGSKDVTVNGVPVLTMDVAPVTTAEGRMLVPFRALGDALGINVTWDATTNTATFN